MVAFHSSCLAIFAFALVLSFTLQSSMPNSVEAKHDHSSSHHHQHHHHSAFPNPRLRQAYDALQAWKRVIYSDPGNLTSDWVGPSVCSYTGIYCAPAPYDPSVQVVAGIDLNHGDIAGFLPEELGLLSDIALIHLNSNRFCGILPQSFANFTLLFELDLSNNRFVGPFPTVVLSLPSLKYLDLRYNEFEGALPPQLFNGALDAIFVNNNRLTNVISSNFSGTSASVVVFANNKFGGCLPPSISKFADTLEELLLINTSLSGCLPPEVGSLYKLRVMDVSYNDFIGPLPYSIAGLAHLEQLNVGHNAFSGVVPLGICSLPSLENFTLSYNFFCEEEGICQNLTSKGISFDDRLNCLPEKPFQRGKKECEAVIEHPVECYEEDYCVSTGTAGVAGFGPAMVPAPNPLPSVPSLAPGPGSA